jgi:hypothetical protein
LRNSIVRMRAALRFALAPEVEIILWETIADAEDDRLAALEVDKWDSEPLKPIRTDHYCRPRRL